MDLNAIPAPKRGWGNIAVASWCHFVGDFYCNLLPVLLPILALKFGLSYSQCGLLYMIFQVSASFLQAPIGIAADKHNLGILLPVSIITSGVLASAVGLCSSAWILVIIISYQEFAHQDSTLLLAVWSLSLRLKEKKF